MSGRGRSGRLFTVYTSNGGKVREIRALLSPLGYRVAWAKGNLPEVQADRLEEVAFSKLMAVPKAKGFVMVEDSGLFVPSLGGFPGVYSAFVLRTIGLEGLLRLVEGRGRAAHFQTVIGMREGTHAHFFHGRVEGQLAEAPRGNEGFGFDPIFVPDGDDPRTFAERSPQEKNRLSHRGRALQALVDDLKLRDSP